MDCIDFQRKKGLTLHSDLWRMFLVFIPVDQKYIFKKAEFLLIIVCMVDVHKKNGSYKRVIW